MNHQYDTAQPRISIVSPGDEHGCQREQEIGQAEAWGEAMFFAAVCGYRINIARWDGRGFNDTQYLTQEDM